MKNHYSTIAITAATVLVVAAGAVSAYDCVDAQGDIQRMQREKQTTAERVLKGATAILPIGFIVHVIKGNEAQTLKQVGTDDYNKHLDARIQSIRQQCGLQ